MRRVWQVTVLLALLVGCSERAIAPPGQMGNRGSDGGARISPDAGPLVAPPMGVAIELTVVGWMGNGDGTGALTLAVNVANGAGADPASLDPAGFKLVTRGGALVSAATRSSPGACSGEVSVLAGATIGCALSFAVSFGDFPQAVRYTPDARNTEAPIDACEAGHPEGLCPLEQACDRGACEERCGAEFCLEDRVCLGAQCRDLCSSNHPDGACPMGGGCRNGQCDLSCPRIDPAFPGCSECLSDANCPAAEGECPRQAECLSCYLSSGVCDCPQNSGCLACPQVAAFFECILVACPSCSG